LPLIQALLPSAPTGRPRCDDRTTPGGVLRKLCSGAAWRTVYDRFARYRDDGTFERVVKRLHLKLDAEGHLDGRSG
jgi:hypothetical protein